MPGAIAVPAKEELETGVPVEMFESPNLDRFVRRARRFLDEERYEDAIAVLQSVVEGRTLEAEPTEAEATPEPEAKQAEAAPEAQGQKSADQTRQFLRELVGNEMRPLRQDHQFGLRDQRLDLV